MNATLSTRQLRLVVILGLFVICAGGYFVVAGHKSQSSTTTSTPAPTRHSTTTPAPAPSKVHPHAATRIAIAVNHGLPLAVAQALGKHSIVVVSLSSPHSDVDQIAGAEARAGAHAAGVGYVNIDVYHQRPGSALLRKLGVVDTPDVLVVKRPYNIFHVFPGFVDRDVVQQAVADAR
jgi:hypothetical protein